MALISFCDFLKTTKPTYFWTFRHLHIFTAKNRSLLTSDNISLNFDSGVVEDLVVFNVDGDAHLPKALDPDDGDKLRRGRIRFGWCDL